MDIAVVVPVRNRPTLVAEAVRSVFEQTRPAARLVVVDDGSTDHTAHAAEVAVRAAPANTSAQVIRAPHAGAAAARQRGLGAAGPVDTVVFLDSDDLWPADFLERASAVLLRNPSLVGASADRIHADIRTNQHQFHDLSPLTHRPIAWLVHHDAGIGSGSLIRASALRAIGGYPTGESTGHDVQLFLRLFALGPWGHIPGEPVVYRRHHAACRAEADHIYTAIPDANIRHARLYQQAADALPQPPIEVREAMARRWISAAKTCRKLNMPEEGLKCLTQARRYQPISIRAARLKCQLLIAKSRTRPSTPV